MKFGTNNDSTTLAPLKPHILSILNFTVFEVKYTHFGSYHSKLS